MTSQTSMLENDAFFKEYTSHDAIVKYTRATAGFGISYLLDHDYKDVYLQALSSLPAEIRRKGIHILEFGCGGGMNLLHLVSVLGQNGISIEKAVGTDFSPVLIEAARRDARNYLKKDEVQRVEFHVGKNESLIADLASSSGRKQEEFQGSFHFILDVNTIRYCHAAKTQLDCARDIYKLLVPGGVCVTIDMNSKYPCFRSDLKNRLRSVKEEECYVPVLEEYSAPFAATGFELLRKENFCWIPHSAGKALCTVCRALSPFLNLFARKRAMRCLVVARKPLVS